MSVASNSTGNIPTYRFFVTYSATEYEVFPLNFLSTMLVDELESGQVFYRRKFSGTLLFGTNSFVIDELGVEQNRMDDWTLFWTIESADPCVKIPFWIEKTVGGVMAVYWEGYFSTSDGFIDIDRCTFEVAPMADDCYTDILENADIQHNIFDTSTTRITTRALRGTIDKTYDRNIWLYHATEDNVIEYFASLLVPGCAVSTTFFSAANNPATGVTNHLKLLTIAQKSDIINPGSSDGATSAMISWNELMDILWAMFQVAWTYDPAGAGTFTIEHISFWNKALGLDLRGDPMTTATNKYSYLKEKMPRFEEFAFMESSNPDFYGSAIDYCTAVATVPSKCVDQNPDTYSKKTAINVTTDLEFIYTYPEAISNDGFVILQNYVFSTPPNVYYVGVELGMYAGEIRLNNHLAWANLHYRYYMHNRVLLNGWMNGAYTTFFTAQKTKQQDCSIVICPVNAYDPDDAIATELGQTYFGGALATVGRSELKPSGEIHFNLLYGPADNAITNITDPKFMLIEEGINGIVTHCLDLTATISEASLVNLAVLIKFVVYDSTDTAVWNNGAGETWTMLAGAGPYTITLTDDGGGVVTTALQGGGRIYFTMAWAVVGDPTWNVWFDYGAGCRYCI